MGEDQMLKCLIAFILGYLVSRYMENEIVGNGLMVGAETPVCNCVNLGGDKTKPPQGCHYDAEYDEEASVAEKKRSYYTCNPDVINKNASIFDRIKNIN